MLILTREYENGFPNHNKCSGKMTVLILLGIFCNVIKNDRRLCEARNQRHRVAVYMAVGS